MGFLDKLRPRPISMDDVLARVSEAIHTDGGYEFLIARPTAEMRQLLVAQYSDAVLTEDGLDQGRTVTLSLRGEKADEFHALYHAYKIAHHAQKQEGLATMIRQTLNPALSDEKFYDLVIEPIEPMGEKKIRVTLTHKGWLPDAFDRKFPETNFAKRAEILEPVKDSREPVKARITLAGEDAKRFTKEYAAHLGRPKAALDRW